MSQTISKDPCPDCKSSDNLHTWEHKGKQYRKCHTPGCRELERLHRDALVKESYEKHDNGEDFLASGKEEVVFLKGEYKSVRNISADVCKKIGISVHNDKTLLFSYKACQKVRIQTGGKKKMYWEGEQTNAGLFGSHIDYDFNLSIIITEGEIDAASVLEAGYQAYSIRQGAGDKKTADEIKENLELLSRFKEIIFWFDSDEAGQKALKEVLALDSMPLHKVKTIYSTHKDANEALSIGTEAVLAAIKEAKEYRPQGIVFGSEIDFNIFMEPPVLGIPYPFEFMEDFYHGLRPTEILLIGAGTGGGKSLFCKHLLLHWIKNFKDLRIAHLFLEEDYKFTLQSIVALDLEIAPDVLVENPKQIYADHAKKLLGKRHYTFETHFGSIDSKQFYKKMRYLAENNDVVVLDHISIVVSGLESSREGERKDLDRMMSKLKEMAMETKTRFIIVSHLNRPDGNKGFEEGMQISIKSFRSSGALAQLATQVIGLERDQQNDSLKSILTIRALKNRFRGGKTGIADVLCYNESTGRLQTT